MGKFIKVFNQNSEYEAYMSGEHFLPNVSYVRENNVVYYTSLGGKLDLDAELLDIAGTAIVFDVDNNKLVTIAGDDYNTTDYPYDKYEPVGVVVMPASHCEDGVARMMSCRMMGVKTATDGTVSYGSYDASNMSEYYNSGSIAWANLDNASATASTESLIAYYQDKEQQFPVATTQPSIYYDETNGANVYSTGGTSGMFYYTDMSVQLNGVFLPDGDTGNGWWVMEENPTIATTAAQLMPSPYNADGSANLSMRLEGSTMEMVHGDVASKMVSDYVKNTTENNRFDIFAAASNYSTSGTLKGQWYVPSPLELAYFSAKMSKIYSTMNKMNPNFDETFDTLMGMDASKDGNYLASWSSTLYSSSRAWLGRLPLDSIYGGGAVYGDGFGFALAPVRNL